jgi:hypothetical protein
MPKSPPLVNSTQEFHSDDTPDPAMIASSTQMTMRSQPMRSSTMSWYRSSSSSSGPARRYGGAMRSAISRLVHASRKKPTMKMSARLSLAPRIPRHTPVWFSESNHR